VADVLVVIRLKRRSWFKPAHGFGEWVGLIGGLSVAAGVVAVVVLLIIGVFRQVSVTVRNDTRAWVRIAGCVDDAADVSAGDTFTAEGIPEHGILFCLITPTAAGTSRCVAVPQAPPRGVAELSGLRVVSTSRCD
jgi:hypothetical protein